MTPTPSAPIATLGISPALLRRTVTFGGEGEPFERKLTGADLLHKRCHRRPRLPDDAHFRPLGRLVEPVQERERARGIERFLGLIAHVLGRASVPEEFEFLIAGL
jgi:hypothetical protein